MKWYLKAAAILASICAIGLLLPLGIGVWLPDIATAPRHILAEERHPSGETLRVIQYWNRVDFYSTELEHIAPNGSKEIFTLDGDDIKTWRVPLTVDWQAKTATVRLRFNRQQKIHWTTGTIDQLTDK